jgi:type II secretory pathway predicted ATPase ExeA
LTTSDLPQRVTLIVGRKGGGKTTSRQRAILPLLNRQEFLSGDRCLYQIIRREELSGDEEQQTFQIFASMARQFSPLTDTLAQIGS